MDEVEWTRSVPAPPVDMGDIDPPDGYSWRKYGSKRTHGDTYPRGYYRCSKREASGCEAKKYVQRCTNDPTILKVTYSGNHTCNVLRNGDYNSRNNSEGPLNNQREEVRVPLPDLNEPVLPEDDPE